MKLRHALYCFVVSLVLASAAWATCPTCSGPDHTKADCDLKALVAGNAEEAAAEAVDDAKDAEELADLMMQVVDSFRQNHWDAAHGPMSQSQQDDYDEMWDAYDYGEIMLEAAEVAMAACSGLIGWGDTAYGNGWYNSAYHYYASAIGEAEDAIDLAHKAISGDDLEWQGFDNAEYVAEQLFDDLYSDCEEEECP